LWSRTKARSYLLRLPSAVRGGALGQQEASEPSDVHLDGEQVAADLGREVLVDDVTGRVLGAAQVDGAEVVARVKVHGATGRFGVEVGEELELHDGLGRGAIGDPTPHAVVIGFELGVPERVLEAGGVHRATGHLEVDLDVNVGRAGVAPVAAGAQEFGNETSEYDELGPGPVMVDDPDEGPLRRGPRRPRPLGVSHGQQLRAGVRPLPRPERQ
jgi:hypothetical protein